MPLSKDEIRSYVDDHGQVAWIPASALLRGRVISCVDGRARMGLIGAPGGSAGEMMVGLAACEATGLRVDPAAVPEILSGWLSRFGRFYMHGDALAMGKLPSWLIGDVQGRVDEAAAAEIEARVADVPAQKRTELLESLSESVIGCGHLNLMLNLPDVYGVRRELTVEMRRAFFRALWRGEPLEYPILAGHHAEGAVCSVTAGEGELRAEDEVPTFAPLVRDRQAFVVHPQAIAFIREAQYRLMVDVLGGKLSKDEWLEHSARISQKQSMETLSRLAPGLPIYEIHYEGRDAFEVIERGNVPKPAAEA